MKGTIIYKQNLEICHAYAKMNPNNCAVRERTADGVSVGPCSYYLPDGKACPRHGEVKGIMTTDCEKCGRPYDLRENSEPTRYCDGCAHIILDELELSRDEWRKLCNEMMEHDEQIREQALREAAELAHKIEWDNVKSLSHLISKSDGTRIQQAILSRISTKTKP